jgi:hypothetical protein
LGAPGSRKAKGITVEQLVAEEDADIPLLPIVERPPGAAVRRIVAPSLSDPLSWRNPREIELALVQPKKLVKLSFLGAERHKAELEMPPEQARHIAYLLAQGADLLDGKVVSVDHEGYEVLVV